MADGDQPLGVFDDFGAFGFDKKEKVKQDNSEKMAKAMERAYAKRNKFVNDLAGSGGEVVRTIIDNFATRIDSLIDTDPECQAYKKILGDIYAQLRIPQKIASRLAQILEIEGAPKK